MNLELLNERLQVLYAQKQDALDRLNQAMADLNAINGSIQEITFWINKIDENKNNI
jgi:hypothetical protein